MKQTTAKKPSVVQNLVVGFGFLNGFWIAIGINPEAILINALLPLASKIHPVLKWSLIIIPLILMAWTFWYIYHHGRILGMIAVLLGFIAGAIVLKQTILSLVLLIIAYCVGWIAFRR